MGKRPARKILGVLSRQKPQKARHNSKGFFTLGRLALIASLVAFMFVSFAYLRPLFKDSSRSAKISLNLKNKSVVDWKIVIRTTDDRPLSDEQMAAIVSLVRSRVSTGSRRELADTAKAIVQKMSLGVAAVTRSGKRGLVVSVSQRVPLLGVSADKDRFLAADGTVFGDYVVDVDTNQSIGPVVTGIFDNRADAHAINANGTLDVTADELELLKESAELYMGVRDSNHKIKSIEFKRFRGFFVVLQTSETEVALGRSPFSGKLVRLHEILKRLEKTSSTAARIELDYQGKAFIKEKKL